ncbi:MAG: SEC-C domain-containing protein [Bacteroidetes bacterium]|nr:SEC-C domain-containing protein [Bacteroidota bacterium]
MLKTTKNSQGHSAFTIHEDSILREIITSCQVSIPWHPTVNPGTQPPPLTNAKALWDTGASNCVITKRLIDALGIQPFTKATVHHGGGTTQCGVYKINIVLPNNVIIPYVNATEGQATTGGFDMIIGMDLITMGDFAITNLGGKTMVSFRTPSNVSIDFNDGETIITPGRKQEKDGERIVINPYSGVSRNALCPCNSGKKFKHCHGAS